MRRIFVQVEWNRSQPFRFVQGPQCRRAFVFRFDRSSKCIQQKGINFNDLANLLSFTGSGASAAPIIGILKSLFNSPMIDSCRRRSLRKDELLLFETVTFVHFNFQSWMHNTLPFHSIHTTIIRQKSALVSFSLLCCYCNNKTPLLGSRLQYIRLRWRPTRRHHIAATDRIEWMNYKTLTDVHRKRQPSERHSI